MTLENAERHALEISPEEIDDDFRDAIGEPESLATPVQGNGPSVVKLPAGTPAADLAEQYLAVRELRAVYWRGEIFRYTGTHYTPIPEGDIKADVLRFLQGGEHRRRAGSRLAHDVVANIQGMTLIPSSVEPPAMLTDGGALSVPVDLLPMRNGILNLACFIRGEEPILPHEAKWFITSSLPFDYCPKAENPTEWLRFLTDLWDDDLESVGTLQEMMGYLLTPDTRQQKIFLIVGPKRSGKGTIARVITALLGRENVVAPTLSSLERNFGLAPLIGKRAAIIADARIGSRADQAAVAEELLSISGEDVRTVHRKFLPAWTGSLPVRFVILSNELPRIADASGALASRFVVLMLNESFIGREDPDLGERLLTELPKISMWALEGLKRLRERGRFLQPSAALEAVRDLEELGSPVLAFLRDRCEIGPGRVIACQWIFDEWCKWCKAAGRDYTGNAQTFGRDLRAVVDGFKVINARAGEKRIRMYSGVTVRSIG